MGSETFLNSDAQPTSAATIAKGLCVYYGLVIGEKKMIRAGEAITKVMELGCSKASFQISDGTFGVPTKEYLTGEFADFYKRKMENMGLAVWDQQSDCDNFAWLFYTDAQWAHYNSKKSTAEGLSVGVVYYQAGARAEGGGGGGHAINVAICGTNHEVVFIEPQFAANGSPCELKLTPAEVASIWFIHF